MHTLFLLNPAAGKADCTRTLPQQIAAAAAGAGLAPEDYTIRVTTHAGHARELSRAAAAAAQKAAEASKKAEAEDVLKKLLASGVSADEILEKLK